MRAPLEIELTPTCHAYKNLYFSEGRKALNVSSETVRRFIKPNGLGTIKGAPREGVINRLENRLICPVGRWRSLFQKTKAGQRGKNER